MTYLSVQISIKWGEGGFCLNQLAGIIVQINIKWGEGGFCLNQLAGIIDYELNPPLQDTIVFFSMTYLSGLMTND